MSIPLRGEFRNIFDRGDDEAVEEVGEAVHGRAVFALEWLEA